MSLLKFVFCLVLVGCITSCVSLKPRSKVGGYQFFEHYDGEIADDYYPGDNRRYCLFALDTAQKKGTFYLVNYFDKRVNTSDHLFIVDVGIRYWNEYEISTVPLNYVFYGKISKYDYDTNPKYREFDLSHEYEEYKETIRSLWMSFQILGKYKMLYGSIHTNNGSDFLKRHAMTEDYIINLKPVKKIAYDRIPGGYEEEVRKLIER